MSIIFWYVCSVQFEFLSQLSTNVLCAAWYRRMTFRRCCQWSMPWCWHVSVIPKHLFLTSKSQLYTYSIFLVSCVRCSRHSWCGVVIKLLQTARSWDLLLKPLLFNVSWNCCVMFIFYSSQTDRHKHFAINPCSPSAPIKTEDQS